MSFKIVRSLFGKMDTITLINNSDGSSAEIALKGATLLKYNILRNNSLFNIIDGFIDEEELNSARGARSWIMVPFANRIPGGKYSFKGKEYELKPIPPKTQVIHGFASYLDYSLKSETISKDKAEVILELDAIKPGIFEGYPFDIKVLVTYLLTSKSLDIKVTIENNGNDSAPASIGWHPYFKTGDNGIEHLVMEINSQKIIRLDNNYIPLTGSEAYAEITEYPDLNFNNYLNQKQRVIANRKLDDCYADLISDEKGISTCSLYDPNTGMKINMYQKGGVTLAFSGDSLAERKRESVALEPMQFLTNAFNRDEFANKISIESGTSKSFEFGVRVDTE